MVAFWSVRPGLTRAEGPPAGTPDVRSPGAGATDPGGPGGQRGQSSGSILAACLSPVGLLIILLSVGAVALVIEHVMTIRTSVLMPPGLAEEVRELLGSGKVGPAGQRCRMEPSFLAHVLGAGLAEVGSGWPAMEKAMEDATAEESARLFRKIEYLSVIGNLAPMLGLLGTVIGMILAFRQVADTQGAARAADLAGGIYLALVTTVEGLIVAIPSLAAFAVFRNRVDHLVAEVTYLAEQVFVPLKRMWAASWAAAAAGPKAPPPPPVGGGPEAASRRPSG
jgi:biopolymer transport protein ExbB